MRTIRFFVSVIVLTSLATSSLLYAEEEEWKGPDRGSEFNFGALAGLGLLDGSAGFALLGTVAQRIAKRGFVSEINDEVYIEAQLGPLFMSQGTALMYGAHLRWDFHKNKTLSLYALGGFGGMVLGSSLGSRVEFYPRVGLGAIFHVSELVSIRTEFSHELIGAGVVIEI
jgi:hypothetical protein